MVGVGVLLRQRSWTTSIRQALGLAARRERENTVIRVQGWVKSVRKHKRYVFIDLNDGSSLKDLQIVAPVDEFPMGQSLSLGCSLMAEGRLVPSNHPQQDVELSPTNIQMIGECCSMQYPFKARTRHGLDYSRQYPHLRARTSMFSALLRVRNTATTAIHNYFQDQGFIHVHTPILTSNDCEGGGDLFHVLPAREMCPPSESSDTEQSRLEFFNSPVYLTVSGQLHAEAITCGGMSKVYTFGPTFRAEKSHTRKHLAEFNMVEAEMVTQQDDNLDVILEVIESLCKHTAEAVVSSASEDVEFFHRQVADPSTKEMVAGMLNKPFKRITYTEAVDILKHSHVKDPFEYLPEWGSDLQSEHEQHLVKHFNGHPVFVTEYPLTLKPFYARGKDEDDSIALSTDLLMSNVGEVAGGSMREERHQVLENKLQHLSKSNEYQWYLDLRKYGTVPHGGFGLGFERLIQALLGINNIRDSIPFPRFLGSCPM